jgi:thioredoxin 1
LVNVNFSELFKYKIKINYNMVAYITELNGENYDDFVKSGIVLVDIWATWCGPCKMISPIVDEISSDYVGRIKVGKCDADANRDKVMELGVRNIPTIFFYKDGEIVDQTYGAVTKKKLTDIIDGLLSPSESVDSSVDSSNIDF